MKKIAFKIYFDVEVNGKTAGASHVETGYFVTEDERLCERRNRFKKERLGSRSRCSREVKMTDAHMVEIDLKVFCKIPLTREEEEYLELHGWEGVKEQHEQNKTELERNYNALVRELNKRRKQNVKK